MVWDISATEVRIHLKIAGKKSLVEKPKSMYISEHSGVKVHTSNHTE